MAELQEQLREQQEQLRAAPKKSQWHKAKYHGKSRKEPPGANPAARIQTSSRFAALRESEGSSTDRQTEWGQVRQHEVLRSKTQDESSRQKVFWSGVPLQMAKTMETQNQQTQNKKDKQQQREDAATGEAPTSRKIRRSEDSEDTGATQDSHIVEANTTSQAGSIDRMGAGAGPQVIPLGLRYVKSNFSDAEKAFFAAAALEGTESQTHFVNPGAAMCYCRPICDKTLNPGGLTKNAARHFLRMRNTPHREYVVTMGETTKKQIHIKTGNIAAQRAGAEPPSGPQAMDWQTRKTGKKLRAPRKKDQNQRQEKKGQATILQK